MRKVAIVKNKNHKRLGTSFSLVKLPRDGETLEIDGNILEVCDLRINNESRLKTASFILDSRDGDLTIKLQISSIKPFKVHK